MIKFTAILLPRVKDSTTGLFVTLLKNGVLYLITVERMPCFSWLKAD